MLVPLKLYVPVVTEILGYSDKLILLKTRSLNTLSEVILKGVHNVASELNEVEGGFEKSKYIDNHRIDAKLHSLIKKLILTCGEILKKYSNNHKSKEIQTYLQSILILLQKVVSFKNQSEFMEYILPQVFKIVKSGTNTMLCCSGIMFVTSAFDLYKADLYSLQEDLINDIVIEQSLKYLRRVLPGGTEYKESFSNAVITSILDSYVILMKSIFNQLLTPEQLTEIFSVFFSIPENKALDGASINQQIDTISTLLSKHVNPQISLHALFNVFDHISKNEDGSENTEERFNLYCSRYFG
jgi:hypothetical protein